MVRKLTFLLLSLARISQANEHLRGSSGGDLEQLMSQMMKKFEALEAKVEEQDAMIKEQNAVMFELQERMETNEANHRRLNETDAAIPDNNECYPTYNSTLKRCIFDQNITFKEEVIFQDKVDFTDDDTNHDQPTVHFDTGVRFGDGDSSHEVEFGCEVIFENDVKFEDDVDFEDDVHFYEDVIVEGPDDSKDEDTVFEVSGHVDVVFKQEDTFEIDTDTLMRKKVRIALDSDDDKYDKHDHRKLRKHRNLKNDESRDVEPTLYVEGSADFETDVTIIEGDLTIEEGGIIVEDGDLIVEEGSIAYQDELINCWDGTPATKNPSSLCDDVSEPY